MEYIDYGNGERKPNCDIVELLPKLEQIKPQALGVILYGLKPVYGANSAAGCNRMLELTQNKTLKCQFQQTSGICH